MAPPHSNTPQITEEDFQLPQFEPLVPIPRWGLDGPPVSDRADRTPPGPSQPRSSAETRSFSDSSFQPATPTFAFLSPSQPMHIVPSRFNTVVNSRSRDTLIIDISDDEDEEVEEELVLHPSNIGSSSSVELPADNTIPEPSFPSPAALVNIPPNRPQCEHDADPPFVTDGRGRVVWSSTRNASGWGAAAEARASRRSRTGSAARPARPSSSAAFVTNGRPVVWTGQDMQDGDEKAVRGEENVDVD
ncbi:hypothetical protein PAXRUDRAFT_830773 [Paxillus rubicundulus Ve08.2h10]|uniref:Uncharacterized protein n=1 Tax=Paxillus rubicundulus Ve08.2h10 TaxID=930991 RepID=A0A0D0DY94_9AGAM|nr:hypothetical protein PAXRUDRAFT_830773 [Paxillus rubicundulus Ve08.2h10]